jgi:hypothetical protein
MMIIRRTEGQWIEITHWTGDVVRVRVCEITPGSPGHLNLAFDDDDRNFEIVKPERRKAKAEKGDVR